MPVPKSLTFYSRKCFIKVYSKYLSKSGKASNKTNVNLQNFNCGHSEMNFHNYAEIFSDILNHLLQIYKKHHSDNN